MPSLMDTASPPIFMEMQAMKEQMEVMMNALKGQVSNDLDDRSEERRVGKECVP